MNSDRHDVDYRNSLLAHRSSQVEARSRMQSEYDKGILFLSASAYAASMVFVKDFVGIEKIVARNYLLNSWLLWGASILLIQISYWTSIKSLQKNVSNLDKVLKDGFGHPVQYIGGFFKATNVMNMGAAVVFVAGLVVFTEFVRTNIINSQTQKNAIQTTIPSSPAVSTSPPATASPQP